MRKGALLVVALPVMTLAGILIAAGSGCDGPCGSGIYNCPAGGGAVYIPQDLPAPVASVTVDSPCTIDTSPPVDGGLIGIDIPGARNQRCTVHATLIDGTAWAATLSFSPLPCCDGSSAPPQTLAPVGS